MKYIFRVKLTSRKFKSSEIDYIQDHIVSSCFFYITIIKSITKTSIDQGIDNTMFCFRMTPYIFRPTTDKIFFTPEWAHKQK